MQKELKDDCLVPKLRKSKVVLSDGVFSIALLLKQHNSANDGETVRPS